MSMKKPEIPHSMFYFWDDSFRERPGSLKGKKWVIDKKAPKNKFGHTPSKLVPDKRPKKLMPAFKKMTQAKVNVFIENFIDALPAEYRMFSKEKLSRIFQIPQHQVHEALIYMNRKGKMEQPTHTPPHDNNRERKLGLGWGGFDGWGQDRYYRVMTDA